MTRERGSTQLSLPLERPRSDSRGRGGARQGAGRPRTSRNVAHVPRPRFDGARTPLHVTLRMAREVWNLRSERGFARVSAALAAERERGELRVVHFSVQGNHLHLVVEAEDHTVLARRMQGFGIRLARRINAMMGRRRGRVIGDRYHARVLGTPREVHRVIRYVLRNHVKHARGRVPASSIDRFSSAALPLVASSTGPPPLVSSPRTWLLRRGWQRAALLEVA